MVVDIRVGIKVIISLKKSKSGLRLKSKLKSRLKLKLKSRLRVIYTFSTAIRPIKCSLTRLLFS